MKRNYRFFDKESNEPRVISFEFEPPFYENLDKYLKENYGEELTFVKEINHKDKILRLHNAYDSGKGTRYVGPAKRKNPRERLSTKVKKILSVRESDILELSMEGHDNLVFLFRRDTTVVYRDASVRDGHVSGYLVTVMPSGRETAFLKRRKYYPHNFQYHTY